MHPQAGHKREIGPLGPRAYFMELFSRISATHDDHKAGNHKQRETRTTIGTSPPAVEPPAAKNKMEEIREARQRSGDARVRRELQNRIFALASGNWLSRAVLHKVLESLEKMARVIQYVVGGGAQNGRKIYLSIYLIG